LLYTAWLQEGMRLLVKGCESWDALVAPVDILP